MSATTTSVSIRDSLLQSLRWRSIGPHRGGRVVAVAGDVTDRETFYMGACAGGVWKTTDAGVTWRNVSDGFFATAAIGAIAVSLSDPNVIYAGTGETAIRGNVSHGDGVYKSTDGGRTWQNVGLRESRHIGDIVIHPTNPDLVYVAALGRVWGPNEERGVYRTKDGGRTWEKVLYKSERAGCHELAMDPSNPRILYAAIWDAQRYPHALRSGGADSGIWKSTDGGDTWTEITRNPGLPKGVLGKIGLAASGAQSGRVWALVEAHDGALFRSDDGGETWEKLSEEPYLRTRAWYYMHVYADPKDADTVWVLNYNVHKSIDGGKTFTEVPSRHGDEHDLWIDPNDTQRMIKGDDGGACVTFNGGRTWSSIFNQPTAQLYHVVADDAFPYRVYGSQQDNSAISVPSASIEGAIHERDWFEPGGGESGYIAIKPSDPDIIVAGAIGSGNFNGRLIHFNRRTGQHRNITVWPELAGMGSGAESLKYRFQWTFPIFWSRHSDALYVAGNRIFRTFDEGYTWEVVSEDLTRNDPEKLRPSGGPITKDNTGAEAYCTVFVLEESPQQRGLMWAGTDDGLVHVSEDGGTTWQNITPPDLPEWALISTIDLSQQDAGTAYMAATRYKLDDTQPYLYRTTDFGATWTKITNGIPDGDFTRVIRHDPNRPGTLYAGTETGIYVSFDEGESWHRLGGNFPVVPVHDLIVKDADLVVATHGRSFWILDDVTQLHQVAEDGPAEGVALLQPRPKLRVKLYGGFGSKPQPGHVTYQGVGTSQYAWEEIKLPNGTTERELIDAGENPPTGIAFQYFLKEAPKDPITLTIKDKKGNLVRSFTSRADAAVSGAATEGAEGSEGTGTPAAAVEDEAKDDPRPTARAGFNRFVWDMRLEPAHTVEGQKLRPWEKPLGPVILPGSYTVELQAGDRTVSQSFEVVKDPRIDISDKDLRDQFELLVKIRDRLSDTNRAITRVRDLRTQVEDWEKRTKGASNADAIAQTAKSIKDELKAVEEELVDVTSGKSSLMAPSRLFEKLNALTEFVDSADARPARQSYEVFDKLSGELDTQLGRVNALVKGPVAAFNKLIQEASLPPVGIAAG